MRENEGKRMCVCMCAFASMRNDFSEGARERENEKERQTERKRRGGATTESIDDTGNMQETER